LISLIGTYYYSNGNKYEGEWLNEERNGEGNSHINLIGILYYFNGNRYEGSWVGDKRNNRGDLL